MSAQGLTGEAPRRAASRRVTATTDADSTPSGWRWMNLAGDWIDYDPAGRLTAESKRKGGLEVRRLIAATPDSCRAQLLGLV